MTWRWTLLSTLSATPKVVRPYLGPSKLAESGFKEGETEEETAPKGLSDTQISYLGCKQSDKY